MVLIKCKMHPQLQWRHDSRHLWSHRYLCDQSLLSHWQASHSFFYSAFVCFVTCSYFHLLNSGSALSLFFSLGFRNVRMPWVPLSRCIFLIPMRSLTSTRTSLLVSQHIYAEFVSQEPRVHVAAPFPKPSAACILQHKHRQPNVCRMQTLYSRVRTLTGTGLKKWYRTSPKNNLF